MANETAQGYVYILTSPRTDCLKIGGTDFPPLKRIREINLSEPYKGLGPWSLADFRQVEKWREVEYSLHYTFRSKADTEIESQKELFHISLFEASAALEKIDQSYIVRKPKIDRLFQDEVFKGYLLRLFGFSGMFSWLDVQGAWTLTLFPSTSGGRYFTLNIGPHEVAFTVAEKHNSKPIHMIMLDKLVLDYLDTVKWVIRHSGDIEEDNYEKALPRSVSISFEGTFAEAHSFLKLEGVRRALLAYWNEALVGMKEEGKLSSYARHHDWNAVALLYHEMQNIV